MEHNPKALKPLPISVSKVLLVWRQRKEPLVREALAHHESAFEFQTMWSIKENDLAVKERLTKMGLLETLISKKEPLSECEQALKQKLITDMLSN